MGETTGIEWCDHTFNPWIGCTKVSPECDNCYAESGSKRLAAQHRLTLWGEASSRYMTGDAYWKQPARWNRAAERDGVRRKVFCASFSDGFEDRPELVEPRQRLKRTVEATPSLDWLLLSKRPENMIRLGWGILRWPSNVWAGTTVGVRDSIGRIDELRKVPVSTRFVSAEPLLEDLGGVDWHGVHWVIIGGESGPRARRFEPEWGERIARHASTEGASVFWKQLGELYSKEHGLRDRHAGDMSEWPEHLRRREFPA